MTDGETLARACASAAADKKADDLVVLDMQGVSTVTDFFVICSASSEPQLKAIANSVIELKRSDGCFERHRKQIRCRSSGMEPSTIAIG